METRSRSERTPAKSVTVLVGAIILFLPGCGTSAPVDDYARQDRINRFLEDYYSTKSYCKSRGLAIVVEHHQAERCSMAERRENGGFCPPRPGDRIVGCASP